MIYPNLPLTQPLIDSAGKTLLEPRPLGGEDTTTVHGAITLIIQIHNGKLTERLLTSLTLVTTESTVMMENITHVEKNLYYNYFFIEKSKLLKIYFFFELIEIILFQKDLIIFINS